MELVFPQRLDTRAFLAEYWQRKPLLMPAALPAYKLPLSAEELAGLACEPQIESRVVLGQGKTTPWEVRQGAFDEAFFAGLPDRDWTLLVQDVDKHLPEIARLLEPFAFLPEWRLDDIMISYAADGGSVGPHVDDYDVFLLQAAGCRRWQIHTRPVAKDNYIEGLALRVLADFEPEHDWVLTPGDILYLPPGVAHWGVAEGDGCITCSVGFKAPGLRELVSSWCHDILMGQVPEGRYRDPGLTLQSHKGEITPDTLDRIGSLLADYLCQTQNLNRRSRWFGRLVTEPKHHLQVDPADPELPSEAWRAAFRRAGRLERNGWSRFAFVRSPPDGGVLFVNGEEYLLADDRNNLLALLTENRNFDYADMEQQLHHPQCLRLMTNLYNDGHLYFPND